MRGSFHTYPGRISSSDLRGKDCWDGNPSGQRKIMTFSYYDDGNVKEISDHRPGSHRHSRRIYTRSDRFEQYDNKINVDGFSLMLQ